MNLAVLQVRWWHIDRGNTLNGAMLMPAHVYSFHLPSPPPPFPPPPGHFSCSGALGAHWLRRRHGEEVRAGIQQGAALEARPRDAEERHPGSRLREEARRAEVRLGGHKLDEARLG